MIEEKNYRPKLKTFVKKMSNDSESKEKNLDSEDYFA